MYEIDTFIFTLQPRFTVDATKHAAKAARLAVFLLRCTVPIGTITHTKARSLNWTQYEAR